MQAAQNGGTINIADLGLGSAEDIIEQMDHAEQEIENIENDDYEKRLQEEKEASKQRDLEKEERHRRENKRAPHLTNLHEEKQSS